MTNVLNLLNEIGIEELRPPQKKVIEEGLLDKSKNFLICIPTASGKTLIGEMALLNHVLDENYNLTGKKGLFIVPLKALASEKFDEFQKKYETYGIKVGMSIGDYDTKEDLSKYNIIITTSEKLDSLMRHNIEWIKDLSLAVIDEIHLIGDNERGGTLEVILTKLKNINAQIVGLSATVGNPEEIANWLNAKLVTDEWRPVELKKGIYLENEINYINNQDSQKKSFKAVKSISRNNLTDLIVDSVNEKGSCLIFCNSKRNAVGESKKHNLTKYLSKAELNDLNSISEEILSILETPTETCKSLSECIKKGVAFHHAGLTYQHRKAVEEGFRNKVIKVICCTPTLSAGLNLPCRRAIIRDIRRYSQNGLIDIPKLEIHQCIGRAGRPGLDPYGEGIILAKNEKDVEKAFLALTGPLENIYSKLSNQKVLRVHILGLIATLEIKSTSELINFIKNTFYAHQYGNLHGVLTNVSKVVEFLEKNKFIETLDDDFTPKKNRVLELTLDNSNNLVLDSKRRMDTLTNLSFKPTNLGKRVSELYIDPLSSEIIIEGLNELKEKINDMDRSNIDQYIFYIISKATEMRPLLRVKMDEELELIQEMDKLKISDYSIENIEAFKNSKMFLDWINETPEEVILEKYGIEPGILRYKVDQARWMTYSSKEIAKLVKLNNDKIYKALLEMEFRIEYGAKEELIELLKIKNIGRVRARRLFNIGIKSKMDILKNPEKIISTFGDKVGKKILDEFGLKYGQQKLSGF
ncbi:DEAD/DEAH box helicase domain protein [Methanococcus vannielii SB]|uniref:ATP-dependent DNA helicase Hel308 n=1 Tax=Methanococcus vannielii (strain ATCC 35089 / DSM 1224 / JCM 13029 / OCM 148 / SB) TaxID=406327 RepID=HELS_METVS|nr:DEAD/DEAH box helicase [Methanococcus vannielii]A6UN73.1 RecName: Full=ATP-dependent DNA helicase Hel308; AltName: Full=DNA 3'-5' helicase Hel308 [Methanococcus vannielii SB]ABR53945.1 DEAD/DEAH box helicase domain protein [Methanococcus vannielii SB]